MGGWGILLLIIMKAYPDGIIIVDFNNFGEFYIEIILFWIMFITIIMFKIIDMNSMVNGGGKDYGKSK